MPSPLVNAAAAERRVEIISFGRRGAAGENERADDGCGDENRHAHERQKNATKIPTRRRFRRLRPISAKFK